MTLSAAGVTWGDTWPTQRDFVTLGGTHRVVPVVRRVLADGLSPVAVYRALANERPRTFILESSQPDGSRSRFSFVGVSCQAELSVRGDHAQWTGDVPVGLSDGEPLACLRQALTTLATEAIDGLPPLTGGLVGLLGWDMVRLWEPTLPAEAAREIDVPDAALMLVADMAAIDHHDGSVWLIANAINANNEDAGIEGAYADACARLDAMERDLATASVADISHLEPEGAGVRVHWRNQPGEYAQIVEVCKQAIRDGEVFQVVPSHRFEVENSASPLDIYRVLRTVNPSPYMYYFQMRDPDGEDYAVVGSSPESLVTVKDDAVLTFPIAGSRPRGRTPDEDKELERELLADPKEIAEHIMLVDLARNDLVKVCEPTSVEVVEFKAVNRYSHIMHICSTVTGRLDPRHSAVDVLTATFPAGTLSGAPKPRAIALIDEVEVARRGFYGGAVGYFDFAGNLDLAITIRTALLQGNTAYVQAGAGIVADSVGEVEEQETRDKAAAMIRAIELAQRLSPIDHG